MGWIVGAIVNVIGSVMINLGTNIIKMGHNKTAAAAPLVPAPITKHPKLWVMFPGKRWFLVGLSIFGVGNILNFASFAFAAQSLLAALGNIQFLTNMVFARFINKEHISRRVMIAMGLVVAGAVLMVSFGNHESPIVTAHELLDLYSEAPYIIYLCIMAVVVVAAYLVYREGKKRIGGLKVQRVIPRPWNRWLPISYALFSGLLGTQSVLYGKTLSMLLRTTIDGDSQFDFWYTYLAMALFLFFAAFWMTRYSKALRLFPVSIIMPILQIVWVLFSIVSGSLYYQEYKTLDALSGSMFGVGIVIMIIGILFLTSGQRQPQPEEGLKEEEMEEHLAAGELDGTPSSSKLLAAGASLPSSSSQQLGDIELNGAALGAPLAFPVRLSPSHIRHARQTSDDSGRPLFTGESSSAAALEGEAPPIGAQEAVAALQEPAARARSAAPTLRAVEEGATVVEVEQSVTSRGRLARTTEMLEENELNTSFGQFARGFAGVDHRTPLSPAFSAFSMPLVPAVGPLQRTHSTNNISLSPAGSQSLQRTVASDSGGAPVRGRHRTQRSRSAGELSCVAIGMETAWAKDSANSAGLEGGDHGSSPACPQQQSPQHSNEPSGPPVQQHSAEVPTIVGQHSGLAATALPLGGHPLAGSAPNLDRSSAPNSAPEAVEPAGRRVRSLERSGAS